MFLFSVLRHNFWHKPSVCAEVSALLLLTLFPGPSWPSVSAPHFQGYCSFVSVTLAGHIRQLYSSSSGLPWLFLTLSNVDIYLFIHSWYILELACQSLWKNLLGYFNGIVKNYRLILLIIYSKCFLSSKFFSTTL